MAVMPAFAANGLPDVVAKYHAEYPQINLAIDNIVMDQAIEKVRSGGCELAIIFAGQNMHGVNFTPLFNDHFMAIYGEAYDDQLSGVNLSASLSALLELPMIAMDKDSSVRRWVDDEFKQYDVQPNIIAEVNQLETLGRLVAKGMGVGIVPSLCQEQMQGFGLSMQALNNDALSRQVGIVTAKNQGLSSAGQAMITVLQEYYMESCFS